MGPLARRRSESSCRDGERRERRAGAHGLRSPPRIGLTAHQTPLFAQVPYFSCLLLPKHPPRPRILTPTHPPHRHRPYPAGDSFKRLAPWVFSERAPERSFLPAAGRTTTLPPAAQPNPRRVAREASAATTSPTCRPVRSSVATHRSRRSTTSRKPRTRSRTAPTASSTRPPPAAANAAGARSSQAPFTRTDTAQPGSRRLGNRGQVVGTRSSEPGSQGWRGRRLGSRRALSEARSTADTLSRAQS